MVLVSPADSYLSLKDRNPTAFHSQIYVGTSSKLCCSGLGSPDWGLGPILLRGNPPELTYPCRASAAVCWSRASLSLVSVLLTSLIVASSVNPWV